MQQPPNLFLLCPYTNWEKGCNETFIWCTCFPVTFHWFNCKSPGTAHLLTPATKPSLLIHHSQVLVSDFTVIQTIDQLFLDSGQDKDHRLKRKKCDSFSRKHLIFPCRAFVSVLPVIRVWLETELCTNPLHCSLKGKSGESSETWDFLTSIIPKQKYTRDVRKVFISSNYCYS